MAQIVKNPPACQCRRCEFDPWVRKFPWRRRWQPTPVFLPGKPHGQRSLVGYRPWSHKRVGHDLATKQQHRCEHVSRLQSAGYFTKGVVYHHYLLTEKRSESQSRCSRGPCHTIAHIRRSWQKGRKRRPEGLCWTGSSRWAESLSF